MTLRPVLMAISPGAAPRTPECVERQRAYARCALSRCAVLSGAPPNGWRAGADGSPLPNEGFHWSVSHKRRWAAAVIADRPVGIDVEHILPRREALLDGLAAPDEWDILGDRSWHSFFRLWTAKEAVLKAIDQGIGGFSTCLLSQAPDLHHLVLVRGRTAWCVEHHYLSDHMAAVVCNDAGVIWHVEENGETEPRPSGRGRLTIGD